MKKILGLFLALFAVFTLSACGEKEFNVDGTFKAFEVGDNYGVPMITWADVVVKGGKVESITLDALQATVDENTLDDDVVEYVFAWNEKTKKELGYAYRMHGPGMSDEDYLAHLEAEGLLEWFEQAELIEAHFLANLDKELSIDDIADVTIDDGGYSNVVAAALENARNNVFVDFEVSVYGGEPQVVWAEVTTDNKGKVEKIFIDTKQAPLVEDKFVWNEKSKKELEYGYRMHGPWFTDDEEYLAHLEAEGLLEWFEQAELIEAHFLANLDKKFSIDDIADVTIDDNGYSKIVEAAINNKK